MKTLDALRAVVCVVLPVLLAGAGLTSCASPGIVELPTVSDHVEPARVLVLYRNDATNVSPPVVPLAVDGRLVAHLGAGQAVRFDVDPGRHFLSFWDDDPRREVFRIRVAAGRTSAVACVFDHQRSDRVLRCAASGARRAEELIERKQFRLLGAPS